MDELGKVVVAVQRAWEEGCPVAGSTHDRREAIARTAIRRWRSWTRRLGGTPSFEERVWDLAVGLSAEYEEHDVGPLIADYRFLAQTIGAALDPQ